MSDGPLPHPRRSRAFTLILCDAQAHLEVLSLIGAGSLVYTCKKMAIRRQLVVLVVVMMVMVVAHRAWKFWAR